MLSKCNCNNCSGHLAFDDDYAGTVINCPHCGVDTTLYIPANGPEQIAKISRQRLRRRLRISALVLLALSVLLVVGFVIYRYGQAIFETLATAVGSTLAAIIGLVIMIIVAVWALLWITFPVFVYFHLNTLIKILKAIEANTRRQKS